MQPGVFYFTEPEVTISKIEEENKYLNLRTQRNGELNADSVRTIDLVRFTNFTIGNNFNVFYAHLPRLKSIFFLNSRLQLNRVATRDSIFSFESNVNSFKGINDRTINVISYGLNGQLVLRPDPR